MVMSARTLNSNFCNSLRIAIIYSTAFFESSLFHQNDLAHRERPVVRLLLLVLNPKSLPSFPYLFGQEVAKSIYPFGSSSQTCPPHDIEVTAPHVTGID